jgi:hypothetical protein
MSILQSKKTSLQSCAALFKLHRKRTRVHLFGASSQEARERGVQQ